MKTANGQMLEIRTLPTGVGTVIVALAGGVDPSSAPLLERELNSLIDAGVRRIVIDATDLGSVDAEGIAVLIAAHRLLIDGGGCLGVYHAVPAIRETLDVNGISEYPLTLGSPGHQNPPAA